MLTDNRQIANDTAKFRTHGLPSTKEVTDWPGIGFNLRYTDIQAAIVMAQFDELDERIKHIKSVEEKYKSTLTDLGAQLIESKRQEVGPYIEVRVMRETPLVLNTGYRNSHFLSLNLYARYISNELCPVAESLTARGCICKWSVTGPCGCGPCL